MNDWAAQAAKQTLDQKTIRDQNTEKSNRDAKIKADAGSRLFNELSDWIGKQVDAYNAALDRGADDSEQLIMSSANSPNNPSSNNRIVVKTRDGRKQPLQIEYSVLSGGLTYKCGGASGTFTLRVDNDGQCHFENQYHEAKSIEDIGTEALNKFLAAKF
jgi:hypothetical protein